MSDYTEVRIGDRVFKMRHGSRIEEPKQIIKYDIPDEYFKNSFNDFITNENNFKIVNSIKNFSMKFMDYRDLSFYIYGKTGTGKTMLAYLALKAIVENRFGTLFVNSNTILDKIVSSYNPRGDAEKNFENKMMNIDFLVIDDLGTESLNRWYYSIFLKTINYRYENKKSTLFTTNMNLKDLKKYMDERILSRIIGMTKNRMYELQGTDWRLKNG